MIGPRILFDGSSPHWLPEREANFTPGREREPTFTLGTLEATGLSRDELHPGKHDGILASRRGDGGQ